MRMWWPWLVPWHGQTRERKREREREREMATRGCSQEENSWQERDSYDLKILRSHVWPLKYYWNTSRGKKPPSGIYVRSLRGQRCKLLLRTTSCTCKRLPPPPREQIISHRRLNRRGLRSFLGTTRSSTREHDSRSSPFPENSHVKWPRSRSCTNVEDRTCPWNTWGLGSAALCNEVLLFYCFSLKLRNYGLTSCAAMTCHARRGFFVPNCNIFSVLNVFKCNPGKTDDKFIVSWQFLSRLISHRRVQRKKKATNHCITAWSIVMVRNQLPAQEVKWWTSFEDSCYANCRTRASFTFDSTSRIFQIVLGIAEKLKKLSEKELKRNDNSRRSEKFFYKTSNRGIASSG